VTPRRLIVVPYFYPPFAGSGNRWPTLARYLREAGHSVTIVATDAFGTLPDDVANGVLRPRDLRTLRLLRRTLRRGDAAKLGTADSAMLTRLLVPDAEVVSWLPTALYVVRRLLARERIDCLVTSGPPDSVHLIGLLAGRRRPAWVADFRDGWCFEPLREPFPTLPQRSLDAALERRVAAAADVAVGATLPIVRDLEARLGARAAYVPNGWDPTSAPHAPFEVAPDAVQLVYTGRFSGVRGSDPRPMLRALQRMNSQPGLAKLKLLIAGPLTAADRSIIQESGASDSVEHLGVLSRDRALALQRAGDALILLTSRNSSEATGKLYEYLGAGRPIVALAAGNEAERIVRETNAGVTVPPDDVDAIADAFGRVASGELTRSYRPRNLEAFTYPRPAEAMAEAIERAITRRAEHK
jgi:glycosyltransferase involved in cell wall biosynthesis